MQSGKTLTTVILMLALAGCGGDSTSSNFVPVTSSAQTVSTSVATPTPSTTRQITGTVTDGPLTGATVAAYEVQPAGILGPPQLAAEAYPLPAPSPLATASTGNSDHFSVTVSKSAGPLIIEVTGGTDRDPVDGQTRPLPQGLRLRAAVPDPSTGVAHVTPYTTIASESPPSRRNPALLHVAGSESVHLRRDLRLSVVRRSGGTYDVPSSSFSTERPNTLANVSSQLSGTGVLPFTALPYTCWQTPRLVATCC